MTSGRLILTRVRAQDQYWQTTAERGRRQSLRGAWRQETVSQNTCNIHTYTTTHTHTHTQVTSEIHAHAHGVIVYYDCMKLTSSMHEVTEKGYRAHG
mmetsp:Transcript_96526/g.155721  ORF Transcript_96526/g.155721 Transcript_96526/m.155721 type:complete len:97 (+) Transcript_96526:264-554(+)